MESFPDEVKRFLDDSIESIEQLEMLRVVWEDPAREWAVADLAKEVQTTPANAATHLAALQARGLLGTAIRDGVVFARAAARTPEQAAQVARLLQLYRERPVTMIRMVYARANAGLRAFAEAFRIRKEG